MSSIDVDARLSELLDSIVRIAAGDRSVRVHLSQAQDEIDGIGVGLNMLAEELEAEQMLRARAEQELSDELEAYERAPAFFCSVDATTLEIARCNTTLATALGMSKSRIVGFSLFALHREEAHDALRGALNDLMAGRTLTDTEFDLVAADGRLVAVSLAGSVAIRRGQRRLRLVWRDVSEQRRLEEQLRQSQKMEAIGSLAGGVAHDFNNLLSVILGATSLALDSLDEAHPARTDLADIQDAADRAATLTRQLLAFGRKQILQTQVVSANSILTDILALIRRSLTENIELTVALSSDPVLVKVDRGAIAQAVLNLAINARDAMPTGGRLLLETFDVRLDAEYVRNHVGARVGEHVVIAVTDSGEGMDAATRQRAFEPFFTTKPVGKGTGLGLAMVYGVVKQTGGHIVVYSEPGRGTSIKLYLPGTTEAVARPSSRPAPRAIEGAETILLLEDNVQVRNTVERILLRCGYKVIPANDSLDALSIVRSHRGSIDLLLTDVVMPGMNGKQVAERVCDLRPSTRVLYMSGYTQNTIVHQGVLDEGVHFLPKPITEEQLTSMVRKVLDLPPQRAAHKGRLGVGGPSSAEPA